ncbi:MAG: hypothetical protein ABS965_03085 [Succiniclasticum sp.]
MKHNFKMTKLVVFMVTLVLTLAVTAVAMAKGADEWKKAEGLYVWKESAQYSNGFLFVKPMEEDLFLFEFKTMRGSEAEDSSYDYNVAGIFLVEDNGVGTAEIDVDKKPVKLTFTLKGKTIAVKQTGTMPADVSGEYDFQQKENHATEAAATAILEGIAPAKTSLNSSNRPYRLVYANETVGGWFYDVRAIHQPTKKMFARFLVAADLTAVYRNDDVKDPKLIYGSPATMLTTEIAPLLQEEEEEEEVQAPEGATEEKVEGKDSDKGENQSRLSAVVNVGPADPAIKVGESSKLAVALPGRLHYKLSDLKSSAGDKVSVDEKGNLTAKAEGTATISGKLTVDNASKEFKVDVNAYVPKLECDVLPTHLEINEKLELSAYITGQEGEVKPEWSVSDSKIAEIKDGVLTAKADGLVDVTAKNGEMKRTWKVAVGKSELPKKGEAAEGDDDFGIFDLLILALPVVLIGGGIWMFMKRRKK